MSVILFVIVVLEMFYSKREFDQAWLSALRPVRLSGVTRIRVLFVTARPGTDYEWDLFTELQAEATEYYYGRNSRGTGRFDQPAWVGAIYTQDTSESGWSDDISKTNW
jgi:hypothetical protein